MGLFSKKTYVCDKCGKEFETRLGILGTICGECVIKEEKEKKALESVVKGYNKYYNDVLFKSYSSDQMKEIIEHRENLLGKLQSEVEISKEEIAVAGDNYKSLTDDQAADILIRSTKVSVTEQFGAAYTKDFFVLTNYENVIIDTKDIFAVGYTTDARSHIDSHEVALCAIFTNDPYVPVFPMVVVLKKGFFELSKSKEGRALLNELFETRCPNLKYPVGDIRDLKKQIKQEGVVKGNLETKFMMDIINSASAGTGIFDTRKMSNNLLPETNAMINRIGYITESEVNSLLRMDKMFNRNYWAKQLDRMLGN